MRKCIDRYVSIAKLFGPIDLHWASGQLYRPGVYLINSTVYESVLNEVVYRQLVPLRIITNRLDFEITSSINSDTASFRQRCLDSHQLQYRSPKFRKLGSDLQQMIATTAGHLAATVHGRTELTNKRFADLLFQITDLSSFVRTYITNEVG